MSLSQSKIDLAVLYKLHQHADQGGGGIPPGEITYLFEPAMPLRRIELALRELLKIGDVEQEYHPHYLEEGLWQVSREGIAKVDRALRVPASFIARLHVNGDHWLESEEARQAVLKKLPPVASIKAEPDVTMTAPFTPGHERSVDWTKWGAVAAWLALPVAIAGVAITIWLSK
ncbi:MAG TPA: hypothetical protein VGC56_00020 [Allosphingosinicella sp.]